jgi:hypothetical protein
MAKPRAYSTHAKPGRPQKFIPEDKDFEQIEAMASRGMNQKHIAMKYGISEAAWYETKARFPQIQERYEKGRGSGIQYVVSLLWERIKKGDERAIYYYLDKVAGFETKGLINISHNYDASQTTINSITNNIDLSKLNERELKTLVVQSMQQLSSNQPLNELEGDKDGSKNSRGTPTS